MKEKKNEGSSRINGMWRRESLKERSGQKRKRKKRIEKKVENHKNNYIAPSIFVTL